MESNAAEAKSTPTGQKSTDQTQTAGTGEAK